MIFFTSRCVFGRNNDMESEQQEPELDFAGEDNVTLALYHQVSCWDARKVQPLMKLFFQMN